MVFSEVVAQNNWIEDQVEAALTATSDELRGLKDLVKVGENLKLGGELITTEHVVNVLKNTKSKSRHDIYETGQGAGVTLAVQYALEKMNYNPGTIDGLMGAKTKAAVKKFQEDWNGQHTDDKITADGFAGEKTIDRMLKVSARQVVTNQHPQAQQTPETETPEVQPSSNNIFDPLFKDNGLTIEQIKSKIEEKGGPKGLLIIRKKGGDLYFALKDPKDDDHIIRYVYNYNSGNPLIQRKELSSFSYGPKVTTLDPEDLRDVRNTDVSTYQKLADKYNQLYKTKGGGRETKKEVYRAIWYNLGDAIDNKDACNLVERATNDPIGKQFRTRGKNQKALGNKNTTLKDFLIWLQP